MFCSPPAVSASPAAIFKFIDNIMALYAHVAAMMLVVVCSVLFLGFNVNTTFVCGFAVCVISLFLYHHNPPAAGDAAAAGKHDASAADASAVKPMPWLGSEGDQLLKDSGKDRARSTASF